MIFVAFIYIFDIMITRGEQMNIKKISILLIFAIFSYYTTTFAAMQQSDITSEAAVLMSATNGQIIYSHNGDEKKSPAGIVKILTCLLAAEKSSINDVVEIQNTYPSTGENNIGLKQGEQIGLQWLIYASLVANANDATNALAEYTSGNVDDFVGQMNERAKQLGCKNTNLTNPTGVYDENQYSTAEDMALITKAALENQHILSILKTAKITIPATNLSDARFYRTNNHLISAFIENKYIYPNALGGKTGYTEQGGYTLSAFAAKGDQKLIAVVLGGSSKDNTILTFRDATNLFDLGFSNFHIKTIAAAGDILYELKLTNSKNTDFVTLVAETSLKALVDKNDVDPKFDKKFDIQKGVAAPIQKGQIIGTVTYSYNGSTVGSINLISSADVEPNFILNTQVMIGKVWGFAPVRWIVYIILIIFALYLLIIPPMVRHIERKANEKYKRRKR